MPARVPKGNEMNDFTVTKVPCCACGATGKVPRLVFWERDCRLCDGEGERKILIHNALSPADREMVLQSAIIGSANYLAMR